MCLHNFSLYKYLYSHFETSSIYTLPSESQNRIQILHHFTNLDFSFKNKNSWEIKLKYTSIQQFNGFILLVIGLWFPCQLSAAPINFKTYQTVDSLFHFCILSMAAEHPTANLIFIIAATCKRRKYIIYVCNLTIILHIIKKNSIPVVMRSKVWVCNRLLVGIVGSNPARGVHVCLLWGFGVVFTTDWSLIQDSYPVGCIRCDR